jgi:uncharacterized membrane protein
MSKQLELVAAVYADEESAQTILDQLQRMHKASTITLADATVVTKTAENKLEVRETREFTVGKGLRRGAIVGGIFGVIFPPSLIATAVAGGALSGAWGKLRDTGIKTDAMRAIGTTLEPGNAAVVALCEPEWVYPIARAMEAYPGKFIRDAFSPDETAQIEEAAESDENT